MHDLTVRFADYPELGDKKDNLWLFFLERHPNPSLMLPVVLKLKEVPSGKPMANDALGISAEAQLASKNSASTREEVNDNHASDCTAHIPSPPNVIDETRSEKYEDYSNVEPTFEPRSSTYPPRSLTSHDPRSYIPAEGITDRPPVSLPLIDGGQRAW